MVDIFITKAKKADSKIACNILRRSIIEVCQKDHNGNQALLAIWLENKTVNNVAKWFAADNSLSLIAALNGNKVGVGMVNNAGIINLCYLLPEALHQGVGKALLKSMIKYAIETDLDSVFVTSTATGKKFYERNGFGYNGESEKYRGIYGYPLVLNLKPSS